MPDQPVDKGVRVSVKGNPQKAVGSSALPALPEPRAQGCWLSGSKDPGKWGAREQKKDFAEAWGALGAPVVSLQVPSLPEVTHRLFVVLPLADGGHMPIHPRA